MLSLLLAAASDAPIYWQDLNLSPNALTIGSFALLGAMDVPHARAFNILGFALPGLLASLVALRLLLRVPRTAPWSPRNSPACWKRADAR